MVTVALAVSICVLPSLVKRIDMALILYVPGGAVKIRRAPSSSMSACSSGVTLQITALPAVPPSAARRTSL